MGKVQFINFHVDTGSKVLKVIESKPGENQYEPNPKETNKGNHSTIRSILLVLAVFLVTGGWGITNAQTKGVVYTNKFVGLTFSVPERWYIATDNETEGLIKDAERVMGLDDPSVKSLVAQMPGMMLVMVSERPFCSDVQSANSNIILVVINE